MYIASLDTLNNLKKQQNTILAKKEYLNKYDQPCCHLHHNNWQIELLVWRNGMHINYSLY